MSREINLDDAIIKGGNAASVLNNPLLKEAFSKIRAELDNKELAVPTTDTECIKDIIRCKQILAGLERCLFRLIQDGKIAQKELEILTPRKRMFSRQ